jgi:RNA polymerase sigma-B factor
MTSSCQGRADPTTEELLRRRAELPAGDPGRARLRAQVIELNLPMSRSLARRYAGRGELLEDLAQIAAIGLIKAVDGYDPSRQVPFVGYAVPGIIGALKRHFRDTAWGMRVPRSLKELARAATSVTDELSQTLGRTPTPADLASHLHVAVDELLAAVGAWQAYDLASLNAPNAGADGADAVDLLGGLDPGYDRVDDYLSLRPLVATLSPRDRRILVLRFYGHLTQSKIGAEVGLSQMQVSRTLAKSMNRLLATAHTARRRPGRAAAAPTRRPSLGLGLERR